MDELDVRIIKLDSMRVVSALGFGASPEMEAWEKLLSWASSKGLLSEISAQRFFGFNNPNPSPGSPNYGYEQWMTIRPETDAEGQVEIKAFPGGRFAVVRCQGPSNLEHTWKKLVAWVEDSTYKMANNYCLEELLNPELMLSPGEQLDFEQLIFDLYLPVAD